MEGPSATIALILAETAAGGTTILWLGGLWGSVKRGFFLLTAGVALGCALLAAIALSSSAGAISTAQERFAVIMVVSVCVLLGLAVAALILRADTAARVAGWLSVPATLLMLWGLAATAAQSSGDSEVGPLIQLVAGSAFLGAVMDGLLLGHWYLTDRRLPRDHIRRFSIVLLVAVGIEAVALAVLGLGDGTADVGGFSVILGVSGLTTWLALGMVGCTALIAFLIRASLRGESARAVQGATGFFYLAVITAFTAEMAAKVGFLG
ncbi:MAG: hypothetical protein ACRDHM_10950 [Actinomycetota bacterium]